MVIRKESNQKIEIGIAGTYRLTARFSYNSTCSSTTNHGIYIHLNGNEILRSYSMRLGQTMVDILDLSKGDLFHVAASCSQSSNHSWDKRFNLFMLEQLRCLSDNIIILISLKLEENV